MQNLLKQFNDVVSRLVSISGILEEQIKETNWSQSRKKHAIQIARKIDNYDLAFGWRESKYQALLPSIELSIIPSELLDAEEIPAFDPSIYICLDNYVIDLISDLNSISNTVQFFYSTRRLMDQDIHQPWLFKITWKF